MCFVISNIQEPVYSTTPHKINAAKNNFQGLSLNRLSSANIKTPPKPYIGSHGP